eukprot:3706730-Amphidinium_carterae.1
MSPRFRCQIHCALTYPECQVHIGPMLDYWASHSRSIQRTTFELHSITSGPRHNKVKRNKRAPYKTDASIFLGL